MTAKTTGTAKKTSAPKAEKGRVLKRKPRTTTPKPRTEKKATTAKQGAPGAKTKGKVTKPATEAAEQEIIPGSLKALGEIFGDKLKRLGKSEGTIRSYAADLKVAMKHFGDEKLVPSLTKEEVEGYFTSDRVTLGRDGKRKNQITIDKVTRVFRQAIEFALAQGWMETNPLPEKAAKAKDSDKSASQEDGQAESQE